MNRARLLAAARTARQGLPSVTGPGAPRAVGIAAGGGLALDPEHFQPRDAIAFDDCRSITLLAGATTDMGISITIPSGYRGVIKERLLALTLADDPAEWANLTWLLKVNATPMAPYGSQVFPMGTLVADSVHVRLEPGSIVTVSVTSASAVDLHPVVRLRGWSYPNR